MRNAILIAVLSLLVSVPALAGKAALVKLIKGDAKAVMDGKETKLKAEDWIDSGAVVITADKSFVKLVFIDKSQMNIGPHSEIKIEKFHNKDAGVIDLVKGKIRSQVSKDYLQIDGKDRSKLFIKTQNAVMGIRGTDFMITTNGKNTAAILFEGEVVFNKLKDHSLTDSAKLDQIVDAGVRMFPGEFSAVGGDSAPTIPALLNVHQREKLEKNANFDKNDSVSKAAKSIVPAGLSGNVVASKPNIETAKTEDHKERASSNPEGFVKDGAIKPANGSFVHLETATVISPGKDASLDSNTNTFIAGDKSGVVNADGTYVPPKDLNLREGRGSIVIQAGSPDQGTLMDRQLGDRGIKVTDHGVYDPNSVKAGTNIPTSTPPTSGTSDGSNTPGPQNVTPPAMPPTPPDPNQNQTAPGPNTTPANQLPVNN